jgi:hypothetical protein
MNEAEARRIVWELPSYLYVDWLVPGGEVTLDGTFTFGQLEALAWIARNEKENLDE